MANKNQVTVKVNVAGNDTSAGKITALGASLKAAIREVEADSKRMTAITQQQVKAAEQSAKASIAVARAKEANAKAVAAELRAEAALNQAIVAEIRVKKELEAVGVSVAKASESASRTLLNEAKTRKELANAELAEGRIAKAAAQEKVEGERKVEAAVKQRIAAENRQQRDENYVSRSRILAENRQHRDENYAIRSGQVVAEKRSQVTGIVSTGAMVGGAAILAGLDAVGQQAAKFDSAMLTIRNNTTMTARDFDLMRETVLKLGKDTGASTDELAQGFMHIVNLGIPDVVKNTANAVTILNAATVAAIGTNTSAAETANILAKALKEFGLQSGEAARVMGVLHRAAAQGNMTLQEFDAAAGPMLSVAAALGVKVEDAAAAFSALTRHGYDATQAATQVRDVFQHLMNPTSGVRKELEHLTKATGVDLVDDFTAAGIKAKGLTGIFLDLAQATKGHADEVYKLIPALRGGQGAMVLASTASKDMTDILKDLMSVRGQDLRQLTGYNDMHGTLANSVARLNNQFLELYTKYGPPVIAVLKDIASGASSIADALNSVDPETRKAIVYFGLFAGGLLTVGGAIGNAIVGFREFRNLLVGARLASTFGEITTAAEAATTAEVATATAGTAAFAVGAPYLLAIAGVIAAVVAIKKAWDEADDAQRKYAAKKATDFASTHTMDVRTNVNNQIGLNNAEIAQRQGELARLQADSRLIRDPSSGRIIPRPNRGLASGVTNSDSVAWEQKRIAALQADANAMTADAQTLSDLQNKRRSLALAISAAEKEEKDNSAKIAFYKKHLRETKGPYSDAAAEIERLTQRNMAVESDRLKNQKALTALPVSAAPMYSGKLLSEAADETRKTFKKLRNECGNFVDALVKLRTGKAFSVGANEKNGADAPLNAQGIGPAGTVYHVRTSKKEGHWFTSEEGPNGVMMAVQDFNGRVRTDIPVADMLKKFPLISAKLGPGAGPATASIKGAAPADSDELRDQADAKLKDAELDSKKAEDAHQWFIDQYNRTGDERNLIWAGQALAKRKRAQIREALAKAGVDATKKTPMPGSASAQLTADKYEIDQQFKRDQQSLQDLIAGGSPKELRKQARDLSILGLQSNLTAYESSRSILENTFSRTGDASLIAPIRANLQSSARTQRQMIWTRAAQEVDDAGGDKDKVRAINHKRDVDIAANRVELSRQLVELDDKENDLRAKGLELSKSETGQTIQRMQSEAETSKSYDKKLSLLELIRLAQQKEIEQQYQIDVTNAHSDKLLLQKAKDDRKAALDQVDLQYQAAKDSTIDDKLKSRAELLRAQADQAATLAERLRLVTEYYTVMLSQPGLTDAESRMLLLEAAQATGDLRRKDAYQGIMLNITSALQPGGANPYAKRALDLSLDQLRDKQVMVGTDEERAQSRGDMLQILGNPDVQKLAGTSDILARLKALRALEVSPDETKAVDEIIDQLTKKTNRSDVLRQVGDNITAALVQGAGQASGDFVHALLHGPGSKDALKSFTAMLTDAAENALSGGVDTLVQGGLKDIGSLFTHHVVLAKKATGDMKQNASETKDAVDHSTIATNAAATGIKDAGKVMDASGKAAKVSMEEGAGAIMMAVSQLMAGGNAKKQQNSAIGGILGMAISLAIPGAGTAGLMLGGGIGSLLGGLFADGGYPPVGKMSIVGERGPEAIVPMGPVKVLSNRELRMMNAPAPIATNGSERGGGLMSVLGSLHAHAANAGRPIEINQNIGSVDSQVDLESSYRSLGKLLENAIRMPIPV
jgi:TP901 family phage tail tape measure protein